jgi:competence protein ComFC
MVGKLLRPVLDFVLPAFCDVCDKPLEKDERVVCEDCMSQIQFISEPYCLRCGKPTKGEKVCRSCFVHPHKLLRIRALGVYTGVLASLIHLLKYTRRLSLAARLGKMVFKLVMEDNFLRRAQLIIPVPLHPTRMRERGYNQSELLAKNIGKYLNIPLFTKALFRVRNTKSQTRLSTEQRRENVKGAFTVKNTTHIAKKHILLVDDVLTTGATLDECAIALLNGGASAVYAVTCAATV